MFEIRIDPNFDYQPILDSVRMTCIDSVAILGFLILLAAVAHAIIRNIGGK